MESTGPIILSNCQYYWKGMNNHILQIHLAIVHCVRQKSQRAQVYPLQMTGIPDRPFEQNSNRPGLRSQCLCIRKSTYTD